jgi:hypothetical protein
MEARKEAEQAEQEAKAGLKDAVEVEEKTRCPARVVAEELLGPIGEDAAGKRRATRPRCGSSASLATQNSPVHE